MTKVEKFAGLILAILTALTFIFWKDITGAQTGIDGLAKVKAAKLDETNKEKSKTKKDESKVDKTTDSRVQIKQRWEMPAVLKEISGLAHMRADLFACIQDEEGKIFVFNTATGKIEKEIRFGDAGDYEGIALVNETAYIVRADGQLFEVKNFSQENPSLVQHKTHLTVKQNVEGLGYDKKNNRLLLAIKGREPNSNDYKGIYAFDLSSKTMDAAPVVKIDLTDKIWSNAGSKKEIQPSDLEVHPGTGDIYVVDGSNPKLLVMGQNGTKKGLYQLSDSDFTQPEGISFSETGELFISNEGKKGSGNILKVSVQE